MILHPILTKFRLYTHTLTHIHTHTYIYYMRWIQVTPGVSLKNYIFFKPLDLSKSNSQRKTLINANILIDLIYYPLFNTFHTYF